MFEIPVKVVVHYAGVFAHVCGFEMLVETSVWSVNNPPYKRPEIQGSASRGALLVLPQYICFQPVVLRTSMIFLFMGQQFISICTD